LDVRYHYILLDLIALASFLEFPASKNHRIKLTHNRGFS